MRYKSVLEMVWKTPVSLKFKLKITWIFLLKKFKKGI